jgi:Putative beta-barrel porin-2, OmpL-like. bbp2
MSKFLLFFSVFFINLSNSMAHSATDSTANPLKISGSADMYYQYSLKRTALPTIFTEQPSSFALGMASVKLEKNVKNVGFVADLAWGPRAENANGSIGTSLASIKQLFVTYAPSNKLKFTFGSFFTHVGYEVTDPTNLNYSTTYGFSKGPFFHTGLKADYTINDNWSLMAGYFDQTDRKFDVKKPRNAGAQLAYHKDDFKVYFNYLGGKISDDTSGLNVQQVDVTAIYQVSTQFGLGFNATDKVYLRKNLKKTNWISVALYENYAVNDQFTLALREEYFTDKAGEALGTLDNSIFTTTLSGNYKINALTLMTELRLDHANKNSFWDSKKNLATNQLPVFLFAAVYVF